MTIATGADRRVSPSRRRTLLLGILLLATALRLINLGGRVLWYDEAFAILYSEKPLSAILNGTIAQVDGAAADVHPLLYYDLLHFWQALFGGSVFAVRLLSVACGVASIALVYLLARELFDDRTALWAALLTAVAPFHINYSQEARMYSLLAMFTLLMVWFFVRATRGCGRGYWIGFALAGALSLYTQNLAFLNVVALGLWILWARRWRLIRPFALSCVAMGVLFAPWLSLLPAQFGKVRQAYWVPRPGVAELVRTLLSFTFNLPVPNWLLPATLTLSLALLGLTLYRVFRVGVAQTSGECHPESKDEGPGGAQGETRRCTQGDIRPVRVRLLTNELRLALTLALAPIVTMFLVSQFKSVYVERGVLPAALAYYILVAAVWTHGVRAPRWAVAVVLLPFAVVALISLRTHYTWDQFPRSPYPRLVAFLRENARPDDAIVHDNKLSFFPAYYYDRTLPQAFVPDPPGSGSDTLALPTQQALGLYATPLGNAVLGHARIWFIVYQRAIDEYRRAGQAGHPDQIWLDERYRARGSWSFNDLNVYLYEQR